MRRKRFWSGFAAGAAAGLGALVVSNMAGRRRHQHVVRLEKSIQIGRPVEEVFDSWSRLDTLPGMSHIVDRIDRQGDRSHWVVRMGGRRFEWDATTEQLIPNQAIGWKSVTGPKHTGRIHFSPLGNDTLVHVTMNYAPPGTMWTRPFAQSVQGKLEGYMEQVLRDFKAALEGKGQEGAIRHTASAASRPGPGSVTPSQAQEERATGTFGAAPSTPGQTSHSNPLSVPASPNPNPVDYTRPPDAKY